jgi:hypothetical protein
MESIYIVSTIEKAEKNIYKVGRHTGTNRSLDSRYTTPLEDPITFYFKPVKTGTAKEIEALIKEKLLPYRRKNLNDSVLEWIDLELEKIIFIIIGMIKEYQKNITIKECVEAEKNIVSSTCNDFAPDPIDPEIQNYESDFGFDTAYSKCIDDMRANNIYLSINDHDKIKTKRTKKTSNIICNYDSNGKIICEYCPYKKGYPASFSNLGNYMTHLKTDKHKKRLLLLNQYFGINIDN